MVWKLNEYGIRILVWGCLRFILVDEAGTATVSDSISGFGLQATRDGVKEMIKRCAEHLDDPEVAQLMDAVNSKLGETDGFGMLLGYGIGDPPS